MWLSARDRQSGANAARAAFLDRHQGEPDGVWSAPGRINVIGEHVDYQDGLCLPAALPHRTYAAVRRRDDRRLTVASVQSETTWEGRLDEVGPGSPAGWPGYVAGVLWALSRQRSDVPALDLPGLDVVIDSDVPLGAGLSSSAALECAVAVAVADLLDGRSPDLDTLTRAAISAENDVVGASTGGMDQAVALRAQAGHALLLDCADGSAEQVPWDPAEHGLDLLVLDTRAEHTLADGQYGSRRAAVEEAARLLGVRTLRELSATDLKTTDLETPDLNATDLDATLARLPGPLRPRARHVVTEIDRVRATVALLRHGRLPEIGPLLDASHSSLRDDYAVSCDELDLAVDTLRAHGALGARMIGGGFGGSVIALLPTTQTTNAAQATCAAFLARGLATPQLLHAPAADGAGRDA